MKKTNKTKDNDQIIKLKEQITDFEDKWKRALADYQNLQKRIENERENFVKFANASLIEKILNIKDDLDRAAAHIKDSGIDMIVKQLEDLLKQEGVKEIEAKGKNFNPETMDCIETRPGKKDKVTKVVQTGYTIGDMVLRPSKVEVGNGKK